MQYHFLGENVTMSSRNSNSVHSTRRFLGAAQAGGLRIHRGLVISITKTSQVAQVRSSQAIYHRYQHPTRSTTIVRRSGCVCSPSSPRPHTYLKVGYRAHTHLHPGHATSEPHRHACRPVGVVPPHPNKATSEQLQSKLPSAKADFILTVAGDLFTRT